MDDQALKRAVREPARLYGGNVEAELVEEIVSDTGRTQDQLPLIQHAMMLLHRNAVATVVPSVDQSNWVLRLGEYRAAGGATQLLSDHANSVINGIIDDGTERKNKARLIERVFKGLTAVSFDGHSIHRPQSIAELITLTGATLTELLAVIEPLPLMACPS